MKIIAQNTAIYMEGLGHAYNPGEWLFRGYDASIQHGKVVSLLGRNGCGKTTLLNLLLKTMRPTEGRVCVQGETAYVPQFFHAAFSYSVLDMVMMGRAKKIGLFSQPSPADRSFCLHTLERFGLAHLAHKNFGDLSGGQRQLVIFARALVSEASIIVLDEPTSALDLRHQNLILDWILRLSNEDQLTILFTTHQLHHAYAVADDALLMLNDGTSLYGAARDVLTESNLSVLYDVPIQRAEVRHNSHSLATLVPIYLGKDKSICRHSHTTHRTDESSQMEQVAGMRR